ncbi:MAG: TetR/AcrR family transcriptional regulator [Longimicrobiales bacterium]
MPRRTAEAAARTRDSLVDAGVEFFAERSYGQAPLEELVGRLGVTRGALYHHFGSKQGFFEAVVERVLARLADRIEQVSAAHGHGWDGLVAGCLTFVSAATDDAFRRIVLLDAPAALGWRVWKEIDDRTAARTLRAGLTQLRDDGELATTDVEPLAAALSGAMNELGLWLADQDPVAPALARAEAMLVTMLAAARNGGPGSDAAAPPGRRPRT